MTFWTSAEIALGNRTDGLEALSDFRVLWCFGWAGAAVLQVQQVRRVLRAPRVRRVRQGPPVLLALQEQARAGLLGGWGCISYPPCFNFPNDGFVGSIPSVHRWSRHGSNSPVRPIEVRSDHLHNFLRGTCAQTLRVRSLKLRTLVRKASRVRRWYWEGLDFVGRSLNGVTSKTWPRGFFLWHHHNGDGQEGKEVEDDEPLEHTVAGQENDGAHGFCEGHGEGA